MTLIYWKDKKGILFRFLTKELVHLFSSTNYFIHVKK